MDIILVNWNSGSRLIEAITSIAQHHDRLVSSVIVVDNASTDASLEHVEALTDLPFPLHIIRNLANRGFGAACNQGAALAGSQYLLFLNPDTRLFQHSLSVPLAFMRRPENEDVGIVGIQHVDEQNHIIRSCAHFPSLGIFLSQALGLNRLPGLKHFAQGMSEWNHNSTVKVDQIMGAFFLMRHALFESLGGFDERFFVYFEEVDLSLRARQSGWRSVYIADAKAFHAGGSASQQVKSHRLFYSLRSRLLYGFKHFTSFRAWLLVGVTLLVESLTRVLFSLMYGGMADVRNTLKGYGMLLQDFPRILRVRNNP